MSSASNHDSLERRLDWLMVIRVITTTFLLGTTIIVQFRRTGGVTDEALTGLYALIGCIYFLTFVYAVILPRLAGLLVQAYIQIFGDVFITTGVIYLTGGIESTFSFMYMLAVINAGILLGTRGALLTASLSAITYGALLDLHYYRYIHPYLSRPEYLDYFRTADILNKILVNMAAFYVVAFLSGYLSREVDSSREKLEERQLLFRRLENLNDNIIQSIDSGLATLSPAGEILSFNAAAEWITGLTFAEVRGHRYDEVFEGLVLSSDPVEGRTPGELWNWTYRRGDGRELFLDMGLLGLSDEAGGHWGRLLVFKDMTRMRTMEEEVKKIERLAAIGEMAAGIAHEIRNPLASMSGSLQMLEEDLNADGDQALLMSIIRREMERLNTIVTDFLAFARPRTGAPVPIDLSRALEEILQFFSHQEGLNARMNIIRDILPGVWVLFDRHQLEQVMWNLLRNAMEAMPGGGDLTVYAGVSDDPQPMAVVEVRDTGSGIAPEDIQKIFDPFFTTRDSGNGLGLSIVFRILENANGRISVVSELGKGAKFTVRLPLADHTR